MNSFWNRAAAGAAALLFFFSFRAAADAGPTVIKMATLAPEGSSWHRVLLEMGEDWKKVSGGTVVLRIYPGGGAGDEVRRPQLGGRGLGPLLREGGLHASLGDEGHEAVHRRRGRPPHAAVQGGGIQARDDFGRGPSSRPPDRPDRRIHT